MNKRVSEAGCCQPAGRHVLLHTISMKLIRFFFRIDPDTLAPELRAKISTEKPPGS